MGVTVVATCFKKVNVRDCVQTFLLFRAEQLTLATILLSICAEQMKDEKVLKRTDW